MHSNLTILQDRKTLTEFKLVIKPKALVTNLPSKKCVLIGIILPLFDKI